MPGSGCLFSSVDGVRLPKRVSELLLSDGLKPKPLQDSHERKPWETPQGRKSKEVNGERVRRRTRESVRTDNFENADGPTWR